MAGLFEDATDLPPPPPEGPGLFGDAQPVAPPMTAAPPVTTAAPSGAPVTTAAPSGAPAYRVLARKYRPTRFEDLLGQDIMVRTLRNAFAMNRIAHAFMLTGVRGVGKTSTARIIARCLNCVGPDGAGGPTVEPCGVCPNCTAILADRHPDVIEMDAASNTGVDDVREIIEATRFRPLQARTKVFVIDEVHMLSRNAFNALLKTLEEPPPHVKFVFATTELRKVPITVLSRCQRFDLRRVGVAELVAHFARVAEREGVAAEAEALAAIARAADGSVRDGLSLLDQAIAQAPEGTLTAAAVAEMLGLADRESVFDLLEAVLRGQPARMLQITARLHELGADPGAALADMLGLIHTLSRLHAVPALKDDPSLPEAERTRGAALAAEASTPVLARAWQMLLKGTVEVEGAPDRRAAAEMVLIRLCHVAELPTPGELVRRLSENPGAPPPPAGGIRAATGGSGGVATARVPSPAPSPAPVTAPVAAPAMPASFRDVVALAAARREASLHSHLNQSVHLVRYAPPVIELRPEPDAPRDLAARLGALLQAETGVRWTIALTQEAGLPTLAQDAAAAVEARIAEAARHPLVRAIMKAFPGTRIVPMETDAAPVAEGAPSVEPATDEIEETEG